MNERYSSILSALSLKDELKKELLSECFFEGEDCLLGQINDSVTQAISNIQFDQSTFVPSLSNGGKNIEAKVSFIADVVCNVSADPGDGTVLNGDVEGVVRGEVLFSGERKARLDKFCLLRIDSLQISEASLNGDDSDDVDPDGGGDIS